VADTVDPLAGSYFVEYLTDQIEEQVWRYLEKIDEMGGAVAAVEQGFIQQEIRRSAYETQKAIERGEQVVVGVNRFRIEEETPPQLLRVDPAVEEKQKQKLQAVRQSRDAQAVQDSLQRLERAARGTDNLMPYILDAVRAYATIGEICDTLRNVFGEYHAH